MLYMRVMLSRMNKGGIITKVMAEAHAKDTLFLLHVEARNLQNLPIGAVVIESASHQQEYPSKEELLDAFDLGVFNATTTLGFVVDFFLDNTTAEGGQGVHTVHVNV